MSQVTRCLLAVVCVAISAQATCAQPYPSKPVKIVVGFGAGGATDGLARKLARRLEKELGAPMVVENRGGMAGLAALDSIATADRAGYVLYVISDQTLAEAAVGDYKRTGVADSLNFISMVGTIPYALVTSASGKNKSIADIKSNLKGQETSIGYGGDLLSRALIDRLGQMQTPKTVAVPYKGSAPALIDVIGGNVSFAVLPVSSLSNRDSKVHVIAVFSGNRIEFLPDTPTAKEQGLDLKWFSAIGLAAPKGTSKAALERIEAAVRKVSRDKEYQDKLRGIGILPTFQDTLAYTAYVGSGWARTSGYGASGPVTGPCDKCPSSQCSPPSESCKACCMAP